ncbi:MAG: biotin/lipoyl-binding protein [SAR202 cluster bacterium]|nr:biotin/lipoyl-binding protein [SAR202 cluster bacterium]|tara:strand:+ start:39981 stop:42065 length:2085 start_codon:yes stop_codon:yes gene_type:complete
MQNSNDIDKLIAESQSRFGKKTFYIFGTIILFITAIIFSYFYFNSDSDSEIISYELHNMTTGSIANTLIASGSTQIDKKISLSFGTSGNLSKIFVEEGESVTAGQILAELDPADLENALERQEITLKKLLEFPTEEDLKSSEYVVNQAEKTLNDLLNYPSTEQLRTAEELVSQAEASFITAQENYDELMMPTDSQFDAVLKLIEQAEQSLANSKLLLDNSVRNVDTSLISLTEAVNSYCDVDTLPNRQDVCVELDNYPINKSITDNILDEIFTCCDANTTEMNLSKALINSNSNYTNSIEQVNVYTKQVESSEASLKDANNTLHNLKNPTQNDIDRLTKLEEQAEKNLQKRIFALEEMKSGSDPEDIKLAQENLEKSKLALERVTEGTDQNDIDIQKLVVEQAKESLSKAKITALFDGQVSSINFKQGEFISAGQSMFTLSDPSTMQMDIIASEAEFVEMSPGMYGLVSLDSKPFPPSLIQITSISNVPNVTQGIVTYPVEARFIRGFEVLSVIQKFTPLLDSFSGMDLSDIPGIPGMSGMGAIPPGIGGMGDSSGDRRTRMGPNNLGDNDMQELQGLLSSLLTEELPAEGMNGTVTLLKDSVQDVLVLPSEALIVDKNKINVISSISDNEIVYTEVKTGLTDGKKTEILEGLKENDSIYIKRIGQVIPEKEESTKSIDELTKGKPPMPRGGKK